MAKPDRVPGGGLERAREAASNGKGPAAAAAGGVAAGGGAETTGASAQAAQVASENGVSMLPIEAAAIIGIVVFVLIFIAVKSGEE